MTTRMAALLALGLWMAVPAQAGPRTGRVDERRPANRDGTIDVEVADGRVRVTGWDRDEIAVTGHVPGKGRLRLTGEGVHVKVEIEPRTPPGEGPVDLEISVPKATHLRVEVFQGAIDVTGITGTVSAENVDGPVSVSGVAEGRVESVNGPVRVRGPLRRMHAESSNGPVTVEDVAGGEVTAGTVNGPVVVRGTGLDAAHLETVNGPLTFDGTLAAHGRLELESISGSAKLFLPESIAATFSLRTMSGDVTVALPGVPSPSPEPEDTGRHGHRRHRRGEGGDRSFTLGSGGARVTVQTLSGRIEVRPRGTAAKD